MAGECNGQCVYVRWSTNAVTVTDIEKSDDVCPDPTAADNQKRLKTKADLWATANSKFDPQCPEEDCQPCALRDMSWAPAGQRDIPISDAWVVTVTIEGHEHECSYELTGTATMDKERGTGECWPKEIKIAMAMFPEYKATIVAEDRQSFTHEEISKISKILA